MWGGCRGVCSFISSAAPNASPLHSLTHSFQPHWPPGVSGTYQTPNTLSTSGTLHFHSLCLEQHTHRCPRGFLQPSFTSVTPICSNHSAPDHLGGNGNLPSVSSLFPMYSSHHSVLDSLVALIPCVNSTSMSAPRASVSVRFVPCCIPLGARNGLVHSRCSINVCSMSG